MFHRAPSHRDPQTAPAPLLREAWHGAPRALLFRRFALAGPSLALTAAIVWLAARSYPAHDALALAVLVAFSLVMGWQAFTAWQYAYGFVAGLLGDRTKSALELASEAPASPPRGEGRTAAIVAIHAEDAVAVFARLRVMARSLAREGTQDIDIFVLSDTRDGAIAAVEEHEFARIQAAAKKIQGQSQAWAEADPALPRIRYRRRRENIGRKAGNVAEFCESHGRDYAFMIVLDADSLMTGAAMTRLVRLMQASPRGCSNSRCVSTRPWRCAAWRLGRGRRGATGAITRSCGSRPSPPMPACRSCPGGRPSGARSCATTSWRGR